MVEASKLPHIKVCGVIELDDVRQALDRGLGAVGLVAHAPSPRAIDVESAAAVVRKLPHSVIAIAVMVDVTPQEARAWMLAAGARAIQLCGRERPEEWSGFEFTILRRIGVAHGAAREIEAWRKIAAGFVLDHPSAPGGSGESVDLELAAELAKLAPCLLAGGLDASNVEERVAIVRPHGVDASSRLESVPGKKDPLRVAAFVRAASRALAAIHGSEGSRSSS